jgi:uncharacterized protein (DUF2147 family)
MAFKVLAGLALAVGVLPSATRASKSAPDLVGRWSTPGGDTVEFGSCANQLADTLICARIVALRDPASSDRRDTRNPAAALRRRPIIGLEIVRALRASSPGVWTGGELCNPDDGRTYRGASRMRGRDSLELQGCALVVICQVQTWRRSGS